MKFDLHIQNIGKLTDAKIRIGRFTVFAGPNNTGKSFVSKILYSLFNAMKVDHVIQNVATLISALVRVTDDLKGHSDEADKLLSLFYQENLSLYLERNAELMTYRSHEQRHEYVLADQFFVEALGYVEHARKMFQNARPSVESLEKENPGLFPFSFSESADRIEKIIDMLESELNNAIQRTASPATARKIEENLLGSFQVGNLSELSGKKGLPSEIRSEYFRCALSGADVVFTLERSWLSKFQKFSNVVYLESPFYWKLKDALEIMALSSNGGIPTTKVGGVPKYFYDLVLALKLGGVGDMAFPEVYRKLTKEVIHGEIEISDVGNLQFQEGGRNFPMSVAAMGIANLGMVALLIKRKVLDKNTLIFIDEPEANLHPAWQVVMAETLFELAKGGAHVAIATHSADILKWLEVHIKKHPEDESLIALNKFPVNGREVDDRDFEYRVAAIKQELTRPFADLYVAGL